ncbi:hypothetical protein [Streptomyces sp. NPDC059928]|uniref:hypothetical protein n=1 Tax=unclassified Streptomyces TaxID=2593676 RepID=UPI003658240C
MLRAPHSRSRRLAVAVAGAALSAGAALALPASASAAPNVTVSCSAAGQTHFSPGVQLWPRPQHVSYQGQEGPCNDNSDIGIRSARITADFDGVTLSCLSGGGTGSGTGTIEWTTLDGYRLRSVVNLTIDETVLNDATVTGYVTDGPLKGHGFSGTFNTNLFSGAGKCTIGAPFGGVKEADFTGEYSIN